MTFMMLSDEGYTNTAQLRVPLISCRKGFAGLDIDELWGYNFQFSVSSMSSAAGQADLNCTSRFCRCQGTRLALHW
jgi:hypothetical protein